MKGPILTAISLWMFLSPLLCLAGVAGHPCGDCDVSLCSHEEECADDPCPDLFLGSWSYREDSVAASVAALHWHLDLDPHSILPVGLLQGFLRAGSTPNLQIFESDLPLLN